MKFLGHEFRCVQSEKGGKSELRETDEEAATQHSSATQHRYLFGKVSSGTKHNDCKDTARLVLSDADGLFLATRSGNFN